MYGFSGSRKPSLEAFDLIAN
ncbi:MAG: hypothetical protein RIT40_1056, partial [Planctomycetota bacterium]